MINELEFKDLKKDCILIDVRSPGEYKDGTIAGAINIPILDDEERKIVGTTYTQSSKNEARRQGVKFVSPKLPEIFDKVLELKKKNTLVVVFCARGGYRSTAFASIFSAIGVNLFKLKDGYKGYRKYVLNNMPNLSKDITYIVMHGNTGVGKTNILYELKNSEFDILDLEGCANHRGSLLGSVCIGNCNTQKTFEANLYQELSDIKSKYVFVEAESKKIGKCVVPEYIFSSMKNGIHINVDASIPYRIESLKKDYVLNENWIEESIAAIDKLRRYISNEKVDDLQNKLRENNFDDVAAFLMTNYYDPMYMHKANEYDYAGKFIAEKSAYNTAFEIKKWFNEYFGG
ncbi:tRNA 2-selenouridine(34) synthase MnmH [Sedimentibacter sp. zth1]|uniref:tRNA 2-selenouridine(34) synthase MnmH n=1 Tax=Sedimentibacter sp. zth1 TaxID=2816908 RepID=UPI001A92D1C4|nr:tRNA 2-selenouridine(34) synthase MnmH [Sedimentibacter sp. zth1]QSX05554.1 tRNA 2-selenouridine(34) synthase MnmH [Sedimentibacter sp. zth1]